MDTGTTTCTETGGVGGGGAEDNDEEADLQLVKRLWKEHDDERTPLRTIPTKEEEDSSMKHLVWSEATAMISLALPVMLTYLLQLLPGIVSIVLVGHIPSSDDKTKEYLDAAALAVMYVNLTTISVGFGLATAMDTLCSQAYGAGELGRKARVYLTTGLIVLSVSFCVMLVLNWYAEVLLLVLGQPLHVSVMAGTFVRYLLPGIPALFLYELLRKVLQAENVAMPMFYVAILANGINAGLGYYLVFGTNVSDDSWVGRILGPDAWLGAAVARTASNLSFPVCLIAYLIPSGRWKALWSSPSPPLPAVATTPTKTTPTLFREAVAGIPCFINLGIPGALQLCFEWWAFEVLALLSGLLPDAILAIGTNAILLNIASMVYMLYMGVSIAANVRIGNALGANQPDRARLASHLTLGLACSCAGLCAIILIVYRTWLPTLFTRDVEIAAYCEKLLWIVACFQVPDSINAAVQGIFRGSGRQSIGAWLNFVAYYVVGLPIGIALAFGIHLGLEGLWIGTTFGLFIVGIVGEFLIRRSDWTKLSKDAIQTLTIVVSSSSLGS